jgi:Fe2+ transport system protein FeoA
VTANIENQSNDCNQNLPDHNNPKANGAGIVVVVTPALDRAGRYTARLQGDPELLVASSRQPLLDACRRLMELGFDPGAPVAMRHVGSGDDALRSTVGNAAKLVVSEGEHDGPRFRPWRASPFREGSPSIAPSLAPEHPEPEAPKPISSKIRKVAS